MNGMDKETQIESDIRKICEYLHYDEEKHWKECGKPKQHIWKRIERVEVWLSQIH
jgi:hypothetical protein